MHQNIVIRERKQPKVRSKMSKLIFLAFLLFLLALPITLWFIEGPIFISSIGYVLGVKEYVIYDTYTLSFDESVPKEYVKKVTENLEKLEFNGRKRFEVRDGKAQIQISRVETEKAKQIFSKDLIPVGHAYSLLNDVGTKNLSKYSFFSLDEIYKELIEEDYGIKVSILSSYEKLLEKLAEDDSNIGLVEFKDLNPKVKILEVDGNYYLKDPTASLSIDFYAKLDKKVDDFVISILSKNTGLGRESWEENRLLKINMSGVVALSRGIAQKMDNLGDYAYPAKEIGTFLADADLTHVSNEASFVPGCKSSSGMSFCSKPEYIETLEKSGVDIVELTGNHNNDFGSEYNAQSIEKYKSLGMRYFGGGLNREDASKILYEQIKGSTVAFVGYNYYDTIYESLALAGEQRAGSNSYSKEKLMRDIQEAKEKADTVIVTFQFQECWSYPDTDVIYPICYKPLSSPDQKAVFRMAVDFGADIVVGTQAHQPQTYELYKEGVIFYGLGNLFFDQNIWIGTRQGLVISHYIYEGKHIQSQVTPIYMGKDDLLPRLATQEQGDLLLKLLREARD